MVPPSPSTATPAAGYALSTSLLCEIESAVAAEPDLRVRSAAITRIVENIYQTVAWVYGEDLHPAELSSLDQVLLAVHAHETRMAQLSLGGGE